MPTSIETAVAGALTTLKAVAGKTVTYARDGDEVHLTALASDQEREAVDRDGLPVVVETRAFDLDPDDLVLDGSAVEPQHGDQVTETLAGTSTTYEVVAPLGLPVFEWVDTHGHQWLRVHAQKVS